MKGFHLSIKFVLVLYCCSILTTGVEWSGVEWSRGEHSRVEPSGKEWSEVSREESRELKMFGEE